MIENDVWKGSLGKCNALAMAMRLVAMCTIQKLNGRV